jgi:hypothetical protein
LPRSDCRFYRTLSRLVACFVATASLLACQQAASDAHPHELLYVLDTDRGTPTSHDHLLVVDPQRRVVVKRYEGSGIDFAMSKDGKHLYLARSDERQDGENLGQLDVIDTASGTVVATANNPNRWITMGPYRSSQMALSTDGRWLYVYRIKRGADATEVAIFDTASNKFLPDSISLTKCGNGVLIPWPSARALSVLCWGFEAPDLWTVQFSDQGVPATQRRAVIPISQDQGRRRVATAFVSGENQVTILMSDGKFVRLNLQSGTTEQEGEIAFSPPLSPPGWHPQTPGAEHVPSVGRRFIGFRTIQQSQGRLYIPLSRSDLHMQAADAIAVVNASTLQQEALFELKSPFWNRSWNLFSDLAVGENGKRLYLLGVESKEGSIRVLSLPDGTQIDAIKGLGATLTTVIPSP